MHLSSVIYGVFVVDKLLFSPADPRAKFIGYLFKFLFINCLIISSVVGNIEVSLDPGLNFGDHIHNIFEDFFSPFLEYNLFGGGKCCICFELCRFTGCNKCPENNSAFFPLSPSSFSFFLPFPLLPFTPPYLSREGETLKPYKYN